MRRPRGQNLADVRAFFARFPGRGFTPTTIGQEVGIPPTSVQQYCTEENGFEQRDGLWYAKEQDPPFDDPFAAPSTRKIGQG